MDHFATIEMLDKYALVWISNVYNGVQIINITDAIHSH